MSYVRRFLDVKFVLGEGDFGVAGSNTVTLTGLRVSAAVENAGGRSMGRLNATIFGMTLSQMNKLSTLGMTVTATRKNSIRLFAHDEGGVPAVVFQGTVYDAYGDFQRAPDVGFVVGAQTAIFPAVTPATPISIRGSGDVASLMSGIAAQAGYAFQNSGVTAKLSNAYYGGSIWDQARAIVRDSGIMWNSGEAGTIAIWPPGGSKGGAIPVVKPPEMITYPSYTANGLLVRTVYNPSIGLGTKIRVESSIGASSKIPATGEWIVYKIDHHLESIVPNGKWESSLLVMQPGTGPFAA
jgi:hypothetical protein